MNAATIRRGSGNGKRPAGKGRNGRGRAVKRTSRMDRILAKLPVSEAAIQRVATWTILAIVGAGVVGAASFMGLPAMAMQELAELSTRTGFQVQKVEVRGVERMDELQVYNIALGQVDRSMVTVDLPHLREQLLQLGWVKDARISRRLPDTLVVDIVERTPAAVWQNGGKLTLIDDSGRVLQPVDVSAMPDLPLVVGPDANAQTRALGTLMDAAPALKPMLAGATWVGDRRWDLRFQSGETLSLPEGDKEAAAALVNFARMDGVNRLLGRGILRFDMRDPDKFVLRVPHKDPAPAAQATQKPAAKAAAPATSGEG